MKIIRTSRRHLDQLAPLFDGYRLFYEQKSDLAAARNFLEERLKLGESVLFMAKMGGEPAGFVQLYPTFSSVSMERSWILNDLFVASTFRKNGVGEGLLRRAQQFVADQKHKGLLLETAADNFAGQRLYEKLGWQKESDDYFFYFWKS